MDEILFLMNGTFEVGYNHMFYLGSKYLQEDDRNAITEALADNIKYGVKKYHYPLKFEPGKLVIGSMELFFNQNS